MKILALTSIRSDYDLLTPLYKLLHNDKEIELKFLVSGAHLSKEFGYTKQFIIQDGYTILHEIESLINSDKPISILKNLFNIFKKFETTGKNGFKEYKY